MNDTDFPMMIWCLPFLIWYDHHDLIIPLLSHYSPIFSQRFSHFCGHFCPNVLSWTPPETSSLQAVAERIVHATSAGDPRAVVGGTWLGPGGGIISNCCGICGLVKKTAMILWGFAEKNLSMVITTVIFTYFHDSWISFTQELREYLHYR